MQYWRIFWPFTRQQMVCRRHFSWILIKIFSANIQINIPNSGSHRGLKDKGKKIYIYIYEKLLENYKETWPNIRICRRNLSPEIIALSIILFQILTHLYKHWRRTDKEMRASIVETKSVTEMRYNLLFGNEWKLDSSLSS